MLLDFSCFCCFSFVVLLYSVIFFLYEIAVLRLLHVFLNYLFWTDSGLLERQSARNDVELHRFHRTPF